MHSKHSAYSSQLFMTLYFKGSKQRKKPFEMLCMYLLSAYWSIGQPGYHLIKDKKLADKDTIMTC
jgi:hypothetical protein